ncbi:MAG: penicillin acylase family protein [Burkholderiaceae bacterium]
MEQWNKMNRASSLVELKGALESVVGIPWVNTIADDRSGNALYPNVSVVPKVSSQGAAVRSIVLLGIGLGIPAANLVAMFPACTGYFVISAGGLTVACVAFDRAGTTRIGRFG